MITKSQIEEELFLALEELENSEELLENPLKAMSNALQRLKGRRRSKGSGDDDDDDRRRRGQQQDDDSDTDPAGGTLSKDTPVSVMKKQKDVVVGQGGQKEMPLVMHIQKMGVSQSTAQAIAKRIGQYLQQRKIPIAEVIERMDSLEEATDVSRVKSSLFSRMRLVMPGNKVRPETKKKEAYFVMALHQVAKSKDAEKFRKFIAKRYKGSADIAALPEEDITQLMNYVLTSPEFKKYHEASYEFRQAQAAEKEKGRQGVRALGKDKGVVGKIVTRFIGDNQELIKKDAGLKAILDDPAKFNKLAKSIRDMLRRQLKRRGYEAGQVSSMLETVEPLLVTLREQRS